MIRRVTSSDPDQLAFRSGSGWLLLLAGTLLVLLGVFVLTAAWGELPAKAIGALMALLGTLAILGRSGVTLDRRRGVAIRWWGLLVPMWRQEMKLAEFDRAEAGREVWMVEGSSHTFFPLLLGRGQGKPLKLGEERSAQRARRLGKDVAKLLGLRLVDWTMGQAIVREAAELDESLRERARRTGQVPGVPDPPPSTRIRTNAVGDTLSFYLPPRGFTAGGILLLVAGVAVPAVLYLILHGPALGGKRGSPFAVCCMLIVFVVCWLVAFSRAKVSALVEVSPVELRVTRRGWLGGRVTGLRMERLEDLEIVGEGACEGKPFPGRGPGKQVLLARSDDASLAFGAGLSPEELKWIKAVIESVVIV